MRISYEWLKTMVELPDDPQDLCREFVRTGTEVETVENTGEAFDHIVTGKVVEKTAHPDSDHLWVTKIDVGSFSTDEQGNPAPLQIVCGAQNFNEGDHVVTALIGAHLPGGITIKKSKLRGVESYGMNCSERELGLAPDSAGIMILPPDAPVGVSFAQYVGLADTIIDAEITPNRPDCLSMYGIATEVGAIYDTDVHLDDPTITPTIQNEHTPATKDQLEVCIDDPELCCRYVARVMHGVKIGPSPEWLARRVNAAGTRSVNNVVDITNYVMYLTGQPLHAFDLHKLMRADDGKYHIVVRAAHEGEQLVTLDGQTRTLTPDMALISDNGEKPVALAGVMGGQNSEIDDDTTDILLESAVFSAGHISRTSRNLDLMSEASIRYERQVDPTQCDRAASIAAALFEQICGAQVAQDAIDCVARSYEHAHMSLRPGRVRQLCGADIADADMQRFLRRLGCKLDCTELPWKVVAPANRPDLTREADMIEEILRLWGMDRVTPTLPAAKNHVGGLTLDQNRVRIIGQTLRSCGLHQTTTYCFADHSDLARLQMSEDGRGLPVELLDPLVSDQSEMRRSIIPGLLRCVAYNLAHGVDDIALYEQGRCFFGSADAAQPAEPSFVSAVLCGAAGEAAWNHKPASYNFFDAKGAIETLLKALRIQKARFEVADPEAYDWLAPGQAATIQVAGEKLGWVGALHPQALHNFDIDVPVIAFELAQDVLLKHAVRELPYQAIPTHPAVQMDIALIVNESVSAQVLMQRIHSAAGPLLTKATLFDVYRDDDLKRANKKSMAVSLLYRASDRSLTSEEVEKIHHKMLAKLEKGLGAQLRA